MQRDRNMPDLESIVESPMWMELTFATSMIRMWWYGFSYNSVCLGLAMIYMELFIIKYGPEVVEFVTTNESCLAIGKIITKIYSAVACIVLSILRIVVVFIQSIVDYYNQKKDEFAENAAKFMDITMGRPIMAPFQTWGMRNNGSDFEISDTENNIGEEAYRDYGQATADSDDGDDGDGDDGDSDDGDDGDDGDDNGLECCDKCGVKDIDPEGLEDGEVNLAEVGGGYAHEGCLSDKEIKEYEKSIRGGSDSDSDSDNEADDELEVKNDEPDVEPNDEPDVEPDDEPGNGEEGNEKEEDYEVVTNPPKVQYNLRQRKKKKSWTSIFY